MEKLPKKLEKISPKISILDKAKEAYIHEQTVTSEWKRTKKEAEDVWSFGMNWFWFIANLYNQQVKEHNKKPEDGEVASR